MNNAKSVNLSYKTPKSLRAINFDTGLKKKTELAFYFVATCTKNIQVPIVT